MENQGKKVINILNLYFVASKNSSKVHVCYSKPSPDGETKLFFDAFNSELIGLASDRRLQYDKLKNYLTERQFKYLKEKCFDKKSFKDFCLPLIYEFELGKKEAGKAK